MSSPKTRITIISAVHNRREITLQCLRSLDRTDTTGIEIRRIIVDGGSTDGTADAIREQSPDVEVIEADDTVWYSKGANIGFRHAIAEHDPDYILLVNDDTIFAPNFLQSLLKTARENERSVVGGLLLSWDEPHRVFQVGAEWDTLFGGWRHPMEQTVWTIPNEPFEVDIIVGNCMFFPAAVFREGHFFDDYWMNHNGDSELTPRLQKLGWKLLIDPRARVFNQPNIYAKSLSKLTFGQKYRALWQNYHHPHNLRNRFMIYWLGAPSRLQGFAGFCVFTVRFLLRPFGIRQEDNLPVEKPLTERYRNN